MDGIKLKDKEILLSKHAVHRANKRKITLEEISEALYNPRNIVRMSKDGYDDSLSHYGRNGITVITNLDKSIVITLIRRNSNYSKSKAKNRKNKRRLNNKRLYGNRAKK